MQLFRWQLRRLRHPDEFSVDELAVEPSSRFFVVAPHSDDEVLGAGGLIHMAVKAGCAVHVAMLTNGDGYNRVALRGQSRRLRATPARAIDFARERQRETVEALRRLGVNEHSLTFLGYPDRGLASMWDRHWQLDTPYRSRFTRATHSPYENSFTPGAPYAGKSLVRDLEQLLRTFQPTHVIVSHPNDFHGDHWAGCCFTLYAIERLRLQGIWPHEPPAVLQYLVHQEPWPKPRGLRPGLGLQPPATWAGLRFPWVTLPLKREAIAQKHDALLSYKSQLVFMRQYLLSFVRSNELFGVSQALQPPRVANGHITIDGDTSDWDDVPGEVLYPMRDSWAKRIGPSADVKSVAVCRDDERLYLRLQLRHKAVDDYTYGITLHGIEVGGDGGDGERPGEKGDVGGPLRARRGLPIGGRRRLDMTLRVPDRLDIKSDGVWDGMDGIVARAGTRGFEVGLPLAALAGPAPLFLGIETRFRGLIIDRPALQMLDLADDYARRE